jgi:hypothetical protein
VNSARNSFQTEVYLNEVVGVKGSAGYCSQLPQCNCLIARVERGGVGKFIA